MLIQEVESCLQAVGLNPRAVQCSKAAGGSNSNYLVHTSSGVYFLKIYKDVNVGRNEIYYIRQAVKYNLAPSVFYIDPDCRFIFLHYVVSDPQFACGVKFNKAYKALSSKLQAPRVQPDLLGIIKPYLDVSIDFNYDALYQSIDYLQGSDLELGWCHMDLHQGNLLFTASNCYIVDYEYSGFNYKIFDYLAVLDFNSELADCFDDSYSDLDLHHAKVYYFLLNYVWFRKASHNQRMLFYEDKIQFYKLRFLNTVCSLI